MAASTAIGSISAYVKEELSYVRKECEPEVDGIFSEMYNTSAGVSRSVGRSNATGASATWAAIVSFSTGVAGAFRNVVATGPATLDQTLTGQTNKWASGARTFPGITEVTSPGSVQKTLTLVQGMGNFVLPFQYFQNDALDASIANAVDIVIRGTAKNVAQIEADMFYTNNATVKPLATFADVSVGVTDGGSDIQFTFDAAGSITGRVGRFLPGMTVDIVDVTASDVVYTGGAGWIVKSVDYVSKTVSIVAPDGATAYTGTIADGDYLINGGSFGAAGGNATIGPSGAETFLVDSGSPYGISLTTHPQFKSLVAAVSGVLDEATLNKYVGGFYDAYGGMYGLDSILTTTGVMTAYMEAIDGLYRYERNNSRLTLREGWSSMDYAWNGQTFKYLASRYQHAGQAYIMKLGDQNLKRYVPPSVKGVGKKGEFNRDIQFVAPWMGSKSIFLPATVSDEVSEFNQAPFVCFREWCPEQIPGVKLTALTEINP